MTTDDNAEIITIGSELLLPDAAETNASFISRILFSAGIQVQYKTAVGDFEKDIARAVQSALKRARWVILTGGLGPTEDDVTREAVARALKRPLALNRNVLNRIKKKIAFRGRPFLKIHERQAWFPEKAVPIPNQTGMAPGFLLKEKKAFLVSLPGVPAEMRQMMESDVFRLVLKNRIRRNCLLFKKYKTFGIPESEVNELLKDLMVRKTAVFGLLAKGTGVEISILLKGDKPQQAAASLRAIEKTVKSRLKDLIYGENEETLEWVVGSQLKSKHKTLAVAESCTGGLCSHRITNVPGSSAYFSGAVVSYSNEIKIRELGVPADLIKHDGAVSSRVAMAMAEGVRKISRSDLGVSITGIAGPGGATVNKPVGLVYFGLSDRKGVRWEEARYPVDRETFKWFASSKALDMVRHHLMAF